MSFLFSRRLPRPFLAAFAFVSLVLVAPARALELPAEVKTAIAQFRVEGPAGWAYTQTTTGPKHSLVERFDPSAQDRPRWTLTLKDNRPPSENDLKEYTKKQSQRTDNPTPNALQQIDPASAQLLSETPERATYRFQLKPQHENDKNAPRMAASIVFHRPTSTIEELLIFNHTPLNPFPTVNVTEARTTLRYSLPDPDKKLPSLLQSITVRIRGSALWFKSLDEDTAVSYSNYTPTAAPPQPSLIDTK